LEAVNEYISSNPHTKCWVAGPKIRGVNYELLDDLISKNHITYYPFIDDQQKWNILSKTHLFILPTFYKIEYLPLAMIDAMLCGCKVVTCDSGEISRYINEYNGKIIEKKNAKAIVQAINEYSFSSHTHDRRKIRDKVVLLFSEEKYKARVLKMLAKY
jgi:glycosyltransferase involved in cell wall biosynthesis